jgi:hypothetical protein
MRSGAIPPTYAPIPLCQAPGAACSGGAFVLRDTARADDLVEIDGWDAEVRKGQRIVFDRGGSEAAYDEALRAALMRSQKALDLMSVSGGICRRRYFGATTDSGWPAQRSIRLPLLGTRQKGGQEWSG